MSATYANVVNQLAGLKELYPKDGDFLQDTIYKKNPLFALMPKNESPQGMGGKYIPCPIVFGGPAGGRSANFSNAQGNQTAPNLDSFFVYRTSNYVVATITNELLEATAGDAGAFMNEAKLVMDTAFRIITNDVALDLYNGGASSGERGTFGLNGGSGSISSGVITLDSPAQIVNFEVGMPLVSYSVSGSTPTQSTGAAVGYVVAINRGTGVLSVSTTQGGSAGTPSNWSTSFPYLAVQGDINFVSSGLATANAVKISGLGAWLPSVAPSPGENFWGVDRSVDSRLYGQIFNGSTESIEEALIDGASLCAREGGQPDYAFMNFTSYASLEKSLGSKVQYVSVKHRSLC